MLLASSLDPHKAINDPAEHVKRSLAVEVLQSQFDRSSVRLELLHLGKLHDGLAYVTQAVLGQVRAGNVLHEGAEIDARVLFGETVRC